MIAEILKFVGIQLAETISRMKMTDEEVAVEAAFPRNLQTGYLVVVRMFAEIQ